MRRTKQPASSRRMAEYMMDGLVLNRAEVCGTGMYEEDGTFVILVDTVHGLGVKARSQLGWLEAATDAIEETEAILIICRTFPSPGERAAAPIPESA